MGSVPCANTKRWMSDRDGPKVACVRSREIILSALTWLSKVASTWYEHEVPSRATAQVKELLQLSCNSFVLKPAARTLSHSCPS